MHRVRQQHKREGADQDVYAKLPAYLRQLIDEGVDGEQRKREIARLAGLLVPRVGPYDALDLMLICVESGMAIEPAFQKVAGEIGTTSPELAEELALTTAELSYLPERSQAFDNLAKRCGHSGVKAVAAALNQAEHYGTPLGQALRVTAQENREMRMTEAEKKAAALPAKLTVPMILFFLPCLFVVILGPAIMRVMSTFHH